MEALISRLDEALNEQKNALCIFDIDSTIFNVSPRNQDIFDFFCSIYKKEHPLLHKLSSAYRLTYQDWGLHPYIEQIKGTMGEDHQLKNQARGFWKKHFFAGTFLHSDQPYPAALELIQFMAAQGARILYLTGRDNARMRKGTLAQLKHWNLPLQADEDLITKPHKGMIDGEYKNHEIQNIISSHPHSSIFFFDNEPSVLKDCIFPEVANYLPVFIDSTHSHRAEVVPTWTKLDAMDYSSLLQALKK